MTFDSSTVVRQLQTLDRQVIDAARHHDAVRMARIRGDWEAVRCTTTRAERHVSAMAITTAHLKAHVVPVDGLGSALGSLSELALRAARLVVFAELDTLRALANARPAASLAPITWGRLDGIEDLTVCVRAALDRITASWRALRGHAQSERAAYRAALQGAHAALRRLGTASEFGPVPLGRAKPHRLAAAAGDVRSDIERIDPLDRPRARSAADHLRDRSHGSHDGAGLVIHGDAPRSPGADGQPAADVLDTYAAAIGAVAELTMALSSAVADVAFADALGSAVSWRMPCAVRRPTSRRSLSLASEPLRSTSSSRCAASRCACSMSPRSSVPRRTRATERPGCARKKRGSPIDWRAARTRASRGHAAVAATRDPTRRRLWGSSLTRIATRTMRRRTLSSSLRRRMRRVRDDDSPQPRRERCAGVRCNGRAFVVGGEGHRDDDPPPTAGRTTVAWPSHPVRCARSAAADHRADQLRDLAACGSVDQALLAGR